MLLKECLVRKNSPEPKQHSGGMEVVPCPEATYNLESDRC